MSSLLFVSGKFFLHPPAAMKLRNARNARQRTTPVALRVGVSAERRDAGGGEERELKSDAREAGDERQHATSTALEQ
jgi:hypothetical protein